LLREPVDNFTFSFVSPLGPDDDHIRHGAPVDSRLFKAAWRLAGSRGNSRCLAWKHRCHDELTGCLQAAMGYRIMESQASCKNRARFAEGGTTH
jgi:hypothetical protein